MKKEQGHLFISLSFSIGFDGAWGVIGVHFTPGFVSNEARHNSLSCCLFIHDGKEFVYFCQKVFLYALQCSQEVASNLLLEGFNLKGRMSSFFKVAQSHLSLRLNVARVKPNFAFSVLSLLLWFAKDLKACDFKSL